MILKVYSSKGLVVAKAMVHAKNLAISVRVVFILPTCAGSKEVAWEIAVLFSSVLTTTYASALAYLF